MSETHSLSLTTAPFRAIRLRSESSERVKSLEKRERKNIEEAARAQLEADVEKVFASVRERLGYKRRDLEVVRGDDYATLRTPDFEYSIQVEPDPETPGSIRWSRELSKIAHLELLEREAFQALFQDSFETLVCELGTQAPIAAIIDRIEEREPPGVRIDYDSRCTWCEVSLDRFPGIFRWEKSQITVRGPGTSAFTLAGRLFELTKILE